MLNHIFLFGNGLAVATTFLVSAFISFREIPKNKARYFILFNTCVALWCLGPILINIIPDYDLALMVQKLAYAFAVFLPPIFLDLAYALSEHKPKKKLIYPFYAISCLLLCFLPTSFFIKGLDTVVNSTLLQSSPGIIYYLFFATIVLHIGFVLALLLNESKKAYSRTHKNQLKFVFIAYSIEYFGGFLYFLTIFKVLPFFTPAGYLVSLGSLLLIYAILKHRLVSIDFVWRYGTSYILYVAASSLFFITLAFLLEPWRVAVLLLFPISCALAPLLSRFHEKTKNKLLYKEHQRGKMLGGLLERIIPIKGDLDRVLRIIADTLHEEFEAQYVLTYTGSETEQGYALYYQSPASLHTPFSTTISTDSPMIKDLICDKKVLFVERHKEITQGQSVPDGIIIPYFAQDALFGFSVLGPKNHNYLYSRADQDAFQAFSNQALMAIENCLFVKEREELMKSLAGSIAHEMRNPLGQIQQTLDEIEAQLPSPSPTETQTVLFHNEITACYDSLGRGQSAIRRGLQVITTTLNEIKGKQIETNEFVYLSARTSTEKAVAEYGYETTSERNKVQVCGNDDFFFKGDETLYQFVLFNLIKNALFYMKTHPAAEVTIRFQPAEQSKQSMNRVIVKDTGPGIPKAVVSNLFKSFYSSGKKSGTGLGLAYCKRVMTAFGGDIDCESVEGDYTEFILSFPNVSQAEVADAQQRMIDAAQAQLHGKRVLLVDDTAGIRQMTRMYLEPFAMQVDEAENGEKAIHQLQKADYDLMILDLRMPVMDGYRAAELIRSGTHFSEGQCRNYMSLPILALTTEVSYLAQVKTEKVGITHFQSKPCTQIPLIQALRTTLEKAAQQKRAAATPLKGKNVLVVDDSAQNRTVLIYNLKPQGIHVIEAATGEAALTLLDQMPCDLILMDVHMPGIDGLETVRRLRSGKPFSEFKNYEKIPVIALSGDDGEEERAAALGAGMNDYLTKPIQREALLNTLTRWFSAHPSVAKPLAEAPVASEKSAPKKQDDLDYLPLLDECSLAKTQAWDAAHAQRLYGYFVAGVEERLEKLETAWEARDMEDFNFHMHTLQGNPGNILAERFPKLVQRMYITVKQGEWPTESLDYLRKVFVETHQAMREKVF